MRFFSEKNSDKLFVNTLVKYSVQGPQLVISDQGPEHMKAEHSLQSMRADYEGPQSMQADHEGSQPFQDNQADITTGLQFGNLRYDKLGVITENIKNKIGEGGFGLVYAGKLDNGTPVAVKVRSQDSSQGDKEFWAEVR